MDTHSNNKYIGLLLNNPGSNPVAVEIFQKLI